MPVPLRIYAGILQVCRGSDRQSYLVTCQKCSSRELKVVEVDLEGGSAKERLLILNGPESSQRVYMLQITENTVGGGV